jgi:ethanolamine permease
MSWVRKFPDGKGLQRRMSDKLKVSGVSYTEQSKDYFEKRQLTRSAGVWGLWGLAIAAVISGDFSGWNFGVAAGGFGGLLVAFLILVVMYYGLMFAIGEMSSAMPHTGGAYSFARKAMGPWGGFVTGLAETIEYVATTAVVVFFSAAYLNGVTAELLGLDLTGSMWIWYVVLYAVFVGLNSLGSAISFRFSIIVSIISLGIIVLFAVVVLASGQIDWSSLWNIPLTRLLLVPAGSCPTASWESCSQFRSVSGCSSESKSFLSPPKNRTTRPRTSPAQVSGRVEPSS